MKLEPGTNLGPYRIISELGRGGMATVYKAYQPALARMVAVKVLPEYSVEEPGFKERFQQEAIAVANLRHPNIPAVYDYGEANGVVYIASEYVDGGTLTDQLGKPLPVEYAIEILTPIAAALDYAHSKGVLHRDVKPSNVLMERDGTPVLADFGLAKMMAPGRTNLTGTGMIMGTPQYMAPEQCEGRELTPAADLYALGVVAYEMLTGRPPFIAETPLAVMLAQVTNTLPPPRQVNPSISEPVQAVLLKALAKKPEDRYVACTRFARALSEAAATTAPEPSEVGQGTSASTSRVVAVDSSAADAATDGGEPSPGREAAGTAATDASPSLAPPPGAPPKPAAASPTMPAARERRPHASEIEPARDVRGLRAPRARLLAAVAVVLVIGLVAGFALWSAAGRNSTPAAAARTSPSQIPTPTALGVQSVVFRGNSSAPVITATGMNFGVEPDGSVAQCGGSKPYSGDVYGNDLYFRSYFPSGATLFGQGTSAQGSCVGIIVTTWSNTEVDFVFGNAYNTQDHWYIATGDSYTLTIKGTQFSGTVAFS
jgi:eukaryotic-like serine/threonine-protein kinase